MNALVPYGSDSEKSDDNGEQQQKQKQSTSCEEEDISREITVSETSTITTKDLPPSSRLPLPLELNCEIFKCLKLPVQRKFIWGLGQDIYEIFGQKLLKTLRLCQAVEEKIPQNLLDLAEKISFDLRDGPDQEYGDDDAYDVNEWTAKLAWAAAAISVKIFALANGIKLTTREELTNFANFFFNRQLLRYWKGAEADCENVYGYNTYNLDCTHILIYELPKLALDANDIEDFKKWMEFMQKNPENLQEKDAQMALMIEKKKGRTETKDQKNNKL